MSFDQVLMLGGDTVTVAAPLVAGASVTAEVLEQFKGEKTIAFVKRRRKHSSQRKRGHRQQLTRVKIIDILAGGKKAAKAKAEKPWRPSPRSSPRELRSRQRWHTRRQAARPATAATARGGGSA